MLVSERAWKVGDRLRLTLEGAVTRFCPEDNSYPVEIRTEGGELVDLRPNWEVDLLHPVISVGDVVLVCNTTKAEVLCIVGDQAWVRTGTGEFFTHRLSILSIFNPLGGA